MIEITVPRLGWSMEEGAFTEWLKRDGDRVEKGDMLFVLESDKAAQEIESFDAGILHIGPISPKPGDTVRVGQVIAHLLAEGESPTAEPPPETSPNLRETTLQSAATFIAAAKDEEKVTKPEPRRAPADVIATPRARRAAGERGVDWRTVAGTGRGGRIRERDVIAARPSPTGEKVSEVHAVEKASDNVLPISATRRAIAERMLASVHATAPVTLTTKFNAANLVNLRSQFKAAAGQRSGAAETAAAPGITDILIKLVAIALRRHADVNARWQDDQIVHLGEINVGFAVDTEAGLLVPVIRQVDTLTVKQVATQSRTLVERARNRRLSADELHGGTFTVSNLGIYGIDVFTPIINAPETAILGVGSIRREAVVLDDDRIVPAEVATLSLTFDHRVIDGAPAARFLQTMRNLVENPAGWLVE